MLADPVLNRAVTVFLVLGLLASLVWFWRFTHAPKHSLCLFCGKPAGDDPVFDRNSEIACRECGEAEIGAQRIEFAAQKHISVTMPGSATVAGNIIERRCDPQTDAVSALKNWNG